MLYQRIASELKEKIDQGLFRAGERLPSVRQMSKRMGISVSTVVSAYQLLEQRQVIEARSRSGFYIGVTEHTHPMVPPGSKGLRPARLHISETIGNIFSLAQSKQLTHFDIGVPHSSYQPHTALKAAANRVIRHQFNRGLNISTTPGDLELRRQIAMRMIPAGCLVSPEQIVITNGCQEALLLSLQTLASPGDVVAVESPCYYGFLLALESLGLQVVNIATDPCTGLDLDALAQAASKWPIRACICASSYSNPTGGSMSDDSKKRLLDIAGRYRFSIIEDDILGELSHSGERQSAIKAFDSDERVIYCSSFSKSISPGLRIGWVVAGSYQQQIVERQMASTTATASFPQQQLTDYLKSGHFEKHLARIRPQYQQNIQIALEIISRHFPQGTRATHPNGGFLLWVALPENCCAMELFKRARQHNIGFVPGVVFGRKGFEHCLRISCAIPWDEKTREQLALLGKLAGH